MRVITTRQLRNETKAIFKMAETERVAVKRGDKLVNLIPQDDPIMGWLDGTLLREYLQIPAEYRVNPFDVSPSGDLFWADRRNVEELDKATKEAHEGPTYRLTREEQRRFLGLE